ncbi:ABC transporter substrate-binding protein [Sesbania bispinosa]|nr:ABC transporter substrate-binding protein [Sesbania bispinosa]
MIGAKAFSPHAYPEEHSKREELDLLGSLETPILVTGGVGGASHIVIPTAILNSVVANQQNLANLVTDLGVQVKAEEMIKQGRNTQTKLDMMKEP